MRTSHLHNARSIYIFIQQLLSLNNGNSITAYYQFFIVKFLCFTSTYLSLTQEAVVAVPSQSDRVVDYLFINHRTGRINLTNGYHSRHKTSTISTTTTSCLLRRAHRLPSGCVVRRIYRAIKLEFIFYRCCGAIKTSPAAVCD